MDGSHIDVLVGDHELWAHGGCVVLCNELVRWNLAGRTRIADGSLLGYLV